MLARGHPATGADPGFPPSISHPIFSLLATAYHGLLARLHQPCSSTGTMAPLILRFYFPKINHVPSFFRLGTVHKAIEEGVALGTAGKPWRGNPESPNPWTLPSSDRVLAVRDQTVTLWLLCHAVAQ